MTLGESIQRSRLIALTCDQHGLMPLPLHRQHSLNNELLPNLERGIASREKLRVLGKGRVRVSLRVRTGSSTRSLALQEKRSGLALG